MTGFLGADTEQLRNAGELLKQRARSIDDLAGRLGPSVLDEAAWVGSDGDAFRSSWTSSAHPALTVTAEMLVSRGDELIRQADEQDQASGQGESGGGGDSAPAPPAQDSSAEEPPWVKLYNKAQSAFSKGKKAWDLVTKSRQWRAAADAIMSVADADKLAKQVALMELYKRWDSKPFFDVFAKPGQEISSAVSRIAGSLGIPTGFGTKRFFGKWVDDAVKWGADKIGDVASWGKKIAPWVDDVAPWIGKAAPVLDVVFGGKQMIDGIQSGDTFSAVTGGASAVGGALMIAGGAMSATGIGAVAGAPIAAVGAVISGAAAVADLGKMVYDNWDGITEAAGNAWDTVSGWAGKVFG